MSNLTIRNLTKSYGSTEVLHGINLEVADGEFVVFVGPSGCGKSTTLRMIAGLEEVTSGDVIIGDRVVNNLQPKERDIAMVFQNYAIYPHMSVKKNIAFGLRTSKLSKADKEKRIQEVAEILSMVPLLDRKPDALSGGQRQRVAIGRAMVRDPAVFLFDEPLSNLDAQLRTQMRLEIKKLHQRVGNTIVFVTHDQVEAMTMADRIVIMKDGHIQQVGTPAEVYHQPANMFVAQFIGAPSMNLLNGNFSGNSIQLDTGTRIPIGHKTPSEELNTPLKVVVGVRPDDLTLDDSNPVISGTITLREPLGPETLIYIDTPSGEVIAKASGRTPPEVGETITLSAEISNLHVFDAKTGEKLP
jgi:multiple sugar transport system ATP-binding protein